MTQVVQWRDGQTVAAAGAERMEIPNVPFVGLYGNWQNAAGGVPWRQEAVDFYMRQPSPVAWFDPTQGGWVGIDEANGDACQERIDALVRHEQRGLELAACVLFHLVMPGSERSPALASRAELGRLAGMRRPTFLVLGGDLVGRNYLRAFVRTAPSIVACTSLAEAIDRSAQHMRDVVPSEFRPDVTTASFRRSLRNPD